MPLEVKLYTALTGSALVTAYTTRIYPVIAPPEVTLPYIVYMRVAGGQINTLSGYATCENPLIQIDIISSSYSQVKTISDNVHSVLNTTTTFRAILQNDTDIFEEELESYRISMDFKCLNKE